jgi:FkbM family methyltransferase
LGELPHFFVGPAYDINVANAVRQVGTFDLGQSYALQTLCRQGDTVLDIGANIGGFTVPLAERVGPSGEVHAFEPFRRVYQHLNANVALNGLSNVFAHNIALGTEEKTVDAYTADLTTPNFPSAMRALHQEDHATAEKNNIKYDQKQEKLTVRRLDSLSFSTRIALIKIDVEFMELDVVLGGLETIKKHRPIMWVENESYFDTPSNRTFVDTMDKEADYRCEPVARLELLCLPKGAVEGEVGGLPAGFKRVFRHLSGEFKDLSLWKALSEVEPPMRR